MRYHLTNAQVLTHGVFHSAEVLVADGRIVSIGDRISCPADTVSVDLHHSVLFPGFVDVHVHLREPGFSYKETIRSGTLAAAHGGFAHVAASALQTSRTWRRMWSHFPMTARASRARA